MQRTFGQAFGELVRTRRGQEGLTQKELAIRAFDDESKVRRINDLETGAVNRPHAKTVDALAVALDIREEELANCRLNKMFTPDEETEIGLSRQLMENLAQRFDHENPNASDGELFEFLKGKADELKLLQDRLRKIDGLTKSIQNQIGAANDAIEAGRIDEADEILAAAEEIQQEERTLKEIEAQSNIRFARGDAALFSHQRSAAAEHYKIAAHYFIGFDKRQAASILELSAGQIYEHERRLLSSNFEHAIALALDAVALTDLQIYKAGWVVAKYRLATLQQSQARILNDESLYDAAIQTCKEAIEYADAKTENEDYSNLQILLGNCYLARSESGHGDDLDDFKSAIKTFEIASQDARVDQPQFHSYLQSSISAAYSKLARSGRDENREEHERKAEKALHRAIELSAEHGQIDLWAACQYNLGSELAAKAQQIEQDDSPAARFFRIRSIAAFNASLEAYPETLLHPHTRRTQMALGRILLEQAGFTADSRREIYLTRSIHAHEVVLAMSSDEAPDTFDAQFYIGLAFFLHAETANRNIAITDLEMALKYYDAALRGLKREDKRGNLSKLEAMRSKAEDRLNGLRAS